MLVTTNTRFNFSISQIAVNHATTSFESGVSALVKYPDGEFILRAHIGREGNYAYHAGAAQVEQIIDAVKLHFKIELQTLISVDSVQIHPNSISVRAKKVVEIWDSNVEHTIEVPYFVEVLCDSIPCGLEFEKDGYKYGSPDDFFATLQGSSAELVKKILTALKVDYRCYTAKEFVDATNGGLNDYSRSYLILAKSLMVNV